MINNRRTTIACAIILGAIMIAVLTPAIAPAAEPTTTYSLAADGLSCPFCAYGIEKQLSSIDGVESVSTDIKSGTVTIFMEAGAILEESAAKRAVEKAGFTMRSFNGGS